MELDQYQSVALQTARSRTDSDEMFHLAFGLVAEAGEVAELFQKLIRDKRSDEGAVDQDHLALELGDVLWHIAVLAKYFGLTLDEVAAANVKKLADRQQRGVLGGSGDHR